MTQEGKEEALGLEKQKVENRWSHFFCVFKLGEPFTQEEMDEMLTALTDRDSNLIYYKDLISQLTIDPDM